MESSRMDCDSIMDISMNLNMEENSVLDEVSMEVSNLTTTIAAIPPSEKSIKESVAPIDTPQDMETFSISSQSDKTDMLEKLTLLFAPIQSPKSTLEKQKKVLQASNEKVKALEAELAALEMNLEAQKQVHEEESARLHSVKEENESIENKLLAAQNRIKSLMKDIEDLKNYKPSDEKENISDKSRVELYRQLTGVTFGSYNPNCPNELKGFAAGVGPATNLKTFAFNTAEHSSSLIGGYIWDVLHDMHRKNWDNLEK